MALIAHWPLNGNTNDISGNRWNGNLMGSPTYTNGKIGQAISLNGSTQYVDVPTREYFKWRGQEFSVFLWVNLASDDSDGSIISKPWNGSGNYNYRIANGTNNISVHLSGSQGYSISTSAGSITKGVWNHIGFTVNSTTLRIYINGVKVSETAHGIIGWVPSAGDSTESLCIGTLYPYGMIFNQPTHAVKGLYNDVRIFDHVLTDMEIQEIARAKILHYTFDDMQEPTTNKFLQFTEDGLAPIAGDGSPTHLGLDSNNTFRGLRSVKFQTGTAGNFYINDSARIATDVTSTQWTASIYIKRVDGAAITSVGTYMYVTNNTNVNIDVNVEPVENGWYKVTRTRTGLTAGYPTLFGCYNLGPGVQYYIAMWQIEAKDHDTEYVKGSRTGRVNDYSGFFNHSDPLTEANTPRWTPEAKIGTGGYQFFGIGGSSVSGNNIIIPNNQSQLNLDIRFPFSLSFWIKPTGTSTAAIIRKGGQFEFYKSASKFVYRVWNPTSSDFTSTATYSINTWYHIVMLHDGNSTGKLFVNGILDRTISISGTPSSTTEDLSIGGYTNRTWSVDAIMDDIRFYATALSDKDIRDLYEARAEIEQSGVLYARDLLSNAEETVNLANTKIFGTNVDINGVPSGKYASNSSSYGFTISSVDSIESTGKSITASIYLRSQTDPASTYLFYVFTGTGPDGGWWNFGSGTLTRDWKRIVTTRSDINGPISSIRLYRQNSLGTMDYADLQLEMNDHVTPFASKYRPAIQLPSTLDFAGNEVHETGTANFEDFSTAGITDGLVGYWQLNDNTKDYSGNNYNGTVSNAVSYGEFYRFNGATSSIQLPDEIISTQNIRSNGLTIIAKAKQTINHNGRIFVMTQATGYSDAASGGIGVANGYARAICYDDNIEYKYADATTPITNNQWFHIVGTYNPVDSKLRVYFNGVEEGNGQVITTYSRLITNAENSIGVKNPAAYWFNGDIAYVKLFNRTLTAEEIAIEYNTMFNNEVQVSDNGILYAKDLKQY